MKETFITRELMQSIENFKPIHFSIFIVLPNLKRKERSTYSYRSFSSYVHYSQLRRVSHLSCVQFPLTAWKITVHKWKKRLVLLVTDQGKKC